MGTEIANRRIYSPPAMNHDARHTIEWCLSGAVCDGSTDFKIALSNMPNETERGRLTARYKELMRALQDHDKKEIGACVAEMLASYDVAKQRYKTNKDRMEAVAKYTAELKGVPTWAVGIACDRVRTGKAADISHVYEPTTIQLRVLAVSIAQPFKQECINIGNILAAQKWQEPVSGEMRQRVGQLMQGLADDMRTRLESSRNAEVERDAPRARKITNESIEAEYRAHGEEPKRSGQMLISRSLAKLLGSAA